jgi:glyoxylase-like metal-dependent hydrolase (beta-lactamase superfamily II)
MSAVRARHRPPSKKWTFIIESSFFLPGDVKYNQLEMQGNLLFKKVYFATKGAAGMKLTENVTLLGNRHFNYFLVGKNQAAVVECGVSAGVASFKQQWTTWPNKPAINYLVAPHAHFDHVCGIPALQEMFPDVQLAASREAQKVLNNPKILADFFNQDDQMSQVLMEEGILVEKPVRPQVSSISVDRIMQEGDLLEIEPGLKLETIAAPGHSPDGLAFYLPVDQVMFLSDAAGFQISGERIFPIFFQSYAMYMETIKRLRGYPTQLLAIPHERLWRGSEIPGFYQRALDTAADAFQRIEKMLDEGMEDQAIQLKLLDYYYVGDLRIYSPANIGLCVRLLLRRVKESLDGH